MFKYYVLAGYINRYFLFKRLSMIKQIEMDYRISAYIVTCTSGTTHDLIVLERILKMSEVVSNPFVFVYNKICSI